MDEILNAKNVLGTELEPCCMENSTGWFRNGCCNTDESDFGAHVVCVEVTEGFLQFSKETGNDLSSPNPMFDFPGLKSGDRWCLCAARWVEAYQEGMAPRVHVRSTDESALDFVDLKTLKEFAVDLN